MLLADKPPKLLLFRHKLRRGLLKVVGRLKSKFGSSNRQAVCDGVWGMETGTGRTRDEQGRSDQITPRFMVQVSFN
jgi:hypothetical protein